jgi:uncharacterized membrane protein YkvA (DUF1232 family)
VLNRWKDRTQQLKTETIALYYAYRDPRTPWYARLVAALVVGYAFSPIDLIPDFIPVVGYLDDLVIVPLGIVVALRLIPADVYAESRAKARQRAEEPVSRVAAAAIISVWLALAAGGIWLVAQTVG